MTEISTPTLNYVDPFDIPSPTKPILQNLRTMTMLKYDQQINNPLRPLQISISKSFGT
jgi:hypothetical protein